MHSLLWGWGIELVCFNLTGTNPAQSLQNLNDWLDFFATKLVKGGDPLVFNIDNSRARGLFQGMMAGEHQRFIQCISMHSQVAVECLTAGPGGGPLYAGKMYSLEPTERGKLQIIHCGGGFFN